MKITLLATLCLVAAACAEHTIGCQKNTILWETSTTVEIPYMQCVTNPDRNLGMRFKKVVSDSRCPINANCIWAGEVTVALEIIDGQEVLAALELGSQEKTKVVTVREKSFEITLQQVRPFPKVSEPINPGSYSVELLISPQE